MAGRTLPLSSNQEPGAHLLVALQWSLRACFWFIFAVSVCTLLIWLVPAVRPLVPYRWDAMKADTAVVLLLAGMSLIYTQPGLSPRKQQLGRWTSIAVLAIAIAGGVECLTNLPVGLSSLMALLPPMRHMGRMSPNTASALLLFGVVLVFLRERKSFLAKVVDACALTLLFTMVVFVSGYFYGALRLFGSTLSNHMSLQAMTCLCLLSFFLFTRRAEYGIFSIFLGDGIGSRIARVAAPFALALPFLVVGARDFAVARMVLEPHYATAIATATTSLLAFVLIYTLARRIDYMEREIRVLSLHDELTGLYNRRGFYLLAQQTYALAQRAGGTFCVLFIDVDELKKVNDSYGHDAGDEMLKEMAALLQAGFRESDVIGRLGGDEFAIAARGSAMEITTIARRLDELASRADEGRQYRLTFSWGYSSAHTDPRPTLDAMLQEADIHMYDRKRNRRESEMAVTTILPKSS